MIRQESIWSLSRGRNGAWAPWLLLAVTLGCGPFDLAPPEDATVEVPRPALADGVFPMAVPDVQPGAVPERFALALPATTDDFGREEGLDLIE